MKQNMIISVGAQARQHVQDMVNLVLGKKGQGSLRAHLARSTAGTFALKVTSTGLGFLTALLLARLLGAAGYGAYAYAMAWVGLLGVPATLGFHQLLVRNVAVYYTQEKWDLLHGLLRFSNRLVLITSIILMASAALLGWVLLSSKNNSSMLFALWIALLALPFSALTQLRQAAMRGFQQIIRGQLPEMLIRPLLFLITVAGAYLLFRQYVSAPLVVAVNVVATIIAFGVGAYWLQKAVPNKAKIVEPQIEARAWVSSALPLLFVSGMYVINSQTDIIMLGAMKGAQMVGIYAVIRRAMGLIVFVLISANIALAPTIASLYAGGDIKRLQRIATKSARMILIGSLPIAFSLILFGYWFLSIFGPEFTQGKIALAILSFGQLVNAGMGSVGLILIMTNHERDAAIGVGIAAGLNVLLNAMLIPQWGLEGAAVATATSLVVWNVLLLMWVHRKLGINPTAFGKME